MADAQAIQAALSAFLKAPARVSGIDALAGDASTRRYSRVRMAPGSPVASVIVMEYPDDVAPGGELPFVNVHRYLRKAGVPVPEIYHEAAGAKLLLLEDAGDLMLEGAVAAARTADEFLPHYERCMEILVRIQSEGTRALDGRAMPARLAFDVPKLAEEIDFFFEHAVREYGEIELTEREERAIEDLFLPFLAELAALPRVLAHRDYHSRNVMVVGPARPGGTADVRILDFQDARMGSVFYDLGSILRDSYVTLPEKVGDRGAFAYGLDIAALQRNVKAIGTFGNQARNRGKTLYLRFIPPTVAHLTANFERNPRMRPLAARLLPILSLLSAKAAKEAPP